MNVEDFSDFFVAKTAGCQSSSRSICRYQPPQPFRGGVLFPITQKGFDRFGWLVGFAPGFQQTYPNISKQHGHQLLDVDPTQNLDSIGCHDAGQGPRTLGGQGPGGECSSGRPKTTLMVSMVHCR